MTEWFRSWHGAPTDPKWLSVAKRADVRPVEVVAIVWALLDRASQAADRGSIDGYDAEGLGEFLDCDTSAVEAVIKALHEKGILQDGRFTKWDLRQSRVTGVTERHVTSRTRHERVTDAERARKYRQRKKERENNALKAEAERHVTTLKRRVEKKEDTLEQMLPLETPPESMEFVLKGSGETNSKIARASRIPEDFAPDPTVARSLGLTEAQGKAELAKFRDYWRAKAGREASKLDWLATWRNWCRTAVERRPKSSAPPNGRFQRMAL